MTKLSKPLMREFLSIVASRPSIRAAAALVGCTDVCIHVWIRRSRNGDPALLLDWPEGDEPRQFAEHMITARRMSLLQFESQIRDEVLNGRKRILRNAGTGQIVYELDERFVGVSDADMKLCGFDPPEFYRIKRNADLTPIPAIVYDPAPAHLTIAAATKMIPGMADVKHVHLDHSVHGVVRVGAQPVQLAPPVLEALTDDVAADDVADDDIADDANADLMSENDSAVAFEAEPPTNGRREIDDTERPDIAALRHLATLSPEERRKVFSAKPPREAERRLWEPEERIGEGDVAPGGYAVHAAPKYPRR